MAVDNFASINYQTATIMTFQRLITTLFFLCLTIIASAQTEIELRPDGIVVPRTTPAAVVSPVEGMLIYDADVDAFKYYDGSTWLTI